VCVLKAYKQLQYSTTRP